MSGFAPKTYQTQVLESVEAYFRACHAQPTAAIAYSSRRTDLGHTGIYGPLTPANLDAPGARIEIQPTPRSDARLAWKRARLASARDDWVVPRVIDPAGASGREIGNTFDVRWRWWVVPERARLELGASVLHRGRFAPRGAECKLRRRSHVRLCAADVLVLNASKTLATQKYRHASNRRTPTRMPTHVDSAARTGHTNVRPAMRVSVEFGARQQTKAYCRLRISADREDAGVPQRPSRVDPSRASALEQQAFVCGIQTRANRSIRRE